MRAASRGVLRPALVLIVLFSLCRAADAGRLFLSVVDPEGGGRGVLVLDPDLGDIGGGYPLPEASESLASGLAYSQGTLYYAVTRDLGDTWLYGLDPETGAVLPSYPLPVPGVLNATWSMGALTGLLYIGDTPAEGGSPGQWIREVDPATGALLNTLDLVAANPGFDGVVLGLGSLPDENLLVGWALLPDTGAPFGGLVEIDPLTGVANLLGDPMPDFVGIGLASLDDLIYVGGADSLGASGMVVFGRDGTPLDAWPTEGFFIMDIAADPTPAAIPEPATLAIVALGLLAAAARRRRKAR